MSLWDDDYLNQSDHSISTDLTNERSPLWWRERGEEGGGAGESWTEELTREFPQIWQSSSQPDLSLAQSGHLLNQAHSADLLLVHINQDTVL